jgi:SulP family sulfate permease
VASGVSPARGLYTAIIGGALVSMLSGSRYQIGGPAGAFIVLVAATGAKFGIEGLLLALPVSGMMLALVGLLRLGTLIRHAPPLHRQFQKKTQISVFRYWSDR